MKSFQRTTREMMKEHFDTHYKKAFDSQAAPSFTVVHAKSAMEKGDESFKQKLYLKAAIEYRDSTRAPAYLFDAYYKLGLCAKNFRAHSMLHISGIDKFKFYPLENREALSLNDAAAIFFREALALFPDFNDAEFASKRRPVNPNLSEVIYQLSMCISKGAQIHPIDLVNTRFEESSPQTINSKELEKALLERVVLINPGHHEANEKLKRSSPDLGLKIGVIH